MNRFGYWNKILHVNLSDRTTWIEEPGDAFFRRYGGGRGFIAPLPAEVRARRAPTRSAPTTSWSSRPVSLTGAPVPGAGRHSVGAKSPLTGGFGESESGGFWGAELKRAGWDAHRRPRRLADAGVPLDQRGRRSSSATPRTCGARSPARSQDAILAELGDPRVRVAQIGPAGENLVRYACIANELNEVAGRTGHGRGDGQQAPEGDRGARARRR